MSKVMVTESYLQDVADAIREKGGTDTYTPAEMGNAIRDLPSGGSSYELIDSTEVTVSTTSTTATSVEIWQVPVVPTAKGFFLFRIRDKAGARDGYFYGSDSFFFPYRIFNGNSGADGNGGRIIISKTTAGAWYNYSQGTNSGYGVYVRQYSVQNVRTGIQIYSRYNATYSKTIDGTFTVEWYYLKSPNDVTP